MAERKRKGLLFDEVLPRAKRTAQSLLSLDPQEDVPASQQALEMALGFVPGVGQAMALRDIERARRAEDPAAAAMAAASFIPFGRLLGRGNAGPIMSELDVYHGTPHRFPATEANPLGEFDASKIGTGEGIQRYGHGIYYAESPDVAKKYQTSNELTQTAINGQRIDATDPRYQAAVRISTHGYKDALEKTLAEANSEFLTAEGKARRKELAEQIKALKEQKVSIEKSGSLYKADLPDEMIDLMLDYDKPLYQQSPAVQKAIMNLPNAQKLDENMTGAELLESRFVVPGDKRDKVKEAETLRRLGIVGVKYQMPMSGNRNFVVFPGEEKKVRILERK